MAYRKVGYFCFRFPTRRLSLHTHIGIEIFRIISVILQAMIVDPQGRGTRQEYGKNTARIRQEYGKNTARIRQEYGKNTAKAANEAHQVLGSL
jgi:hypothetical protein